MTDTSDPETLYTSNDVATILGQSVEWVNAQARTGLLPSRKVGRSRRYTAQDVGEYLERVRQGTVNPLARTPRQQAARNRRGSK